MTGNNVTYTYGTSGTGKGRPVRIVDGSGMYECQYDALGNVKEETRTITLPNHNKVYRFRTGYQYDSWGRMLTMTYPDGEEVAYTYQWGGDLYSMHGIKGDNHRVYVGKILYNTFGQRSLVEYGNQTKTYFTYDALHRLVNLRSRKSGGTLMQDISYTFDSASNVTGITNTAGLVNTLGGGYENSYRYDALHRLVWSSGGGVMGSYSMDMGYTPSGRIGEKNRSVQAEAPSETVETIYGYCDTYQPHAVRRIYDKAKDIYYDLRWDGAGNLGQISVANEVALFESGRFLFWTEDSRMHAAVDEKHYSYYTYDHGGERRLKLTGENNLVDVNADYMNTYSDLSSPTLYPSAYMVVSSKGYTKHYYAGAERVAARIGGGGLDARIPLSDGGDSLRTVADNLYAQSLGLVNSRVLERNESDCITGSVAEQDKLRAWIEEIPEQLQATAVTDYGEFTNAVQLLRADHNGGQEWDVYFYHSDHLGSASWITDNDGQAIQHLQYLPYGEPYVNQRTSGYNERFTFTGKEKDEETGYGYFGARYMDHELMTMWLSVDPMADKYPSISPYAYCAGNPVKLVDPEGMEINPVFGSNGRYRGCTKEGYTGSIIIYDGDIDFNELTTDQLIETTSKHKQKAEEYTYSDFRNTMTDNAKSMMYTHIVSQRNGYLVHGAKTPFHINRLKGGKIFFRKAEKSNSGGYITNTKERTITATESNLIPLTQSYAFAYEATVENIQASVIIHEWYGHILRGWCNKNKTHHFCYSAVMNDPLFKRTTTIYQNYIKEMYRRL